MKKDDRRGKRLPLVMFLIFASLFCFSAYKVASQLLTEHREQQAFSDLLAEISASRQAVQHVIPTGAGPETAVTLPTAEAIPVTEAPENTQPVLAGPPDQQTPEASPESTEPAATPSPVTTPTEVPPMLDAYATLYRKNRDLFGWIEIEGTAVSFPVMHTPRNPEYYLHKAFDKTYSFSGVPFMDGSCYPGCGNYIIYGHHMKNGTMFAPIVNYAREDYWREHPFVYFDTLYETGVYEVVAAFYSKVYGKDETDAFRYYLYTDLSDPAAFEEYTAQVRAAAIYDTGIEAVYGDQLITLSTCEYSTTDGRFVVVAKRIDP